MADMLEVGCLSESNQSQIAPDAGALYISTEGEFPIKRYRQMCQLLKERRSQYAHTDFESDLFVECVSTVAELRDLSLDRLPALLRRKNVKLIVVDSVASLIRFEFGAQESTEKGKVLATLVSRWRELSSAFRLPFVVTNQMTDQLSQVEGGEAQSVPALGRSWANLLNVRMVLRRGEALPQTASGERKRNVNGNYIQQKQRDQTAALPIGVLAVRQLTAEFAPHLPATSCNFVVETAGVRGI